jgi:hypothetical protein
MNHNLIKLGYLLGKKAQFLMSPPKEDFIRSVMMRANQPGFTFPQIKQEGQNLFRDQMKNLMNQSKILTKLPIYIKLPLSFPKFLV